MQKEETVHKTLNKDGYSIHYFITGNRKNEAIVFLHPAFGDHRFFDKQTGFFSKEYCVITIDLMGHGMSQVQKSKDKIDSSALHIHEILQAEGIEKAHLAGVSMGSLIVQDFVQKYPEKTLSLAATGGYNIHTKNEKVYKQQKGEFFKWAFKILFSMNSFRKYIGSVAGINEDTRKQAFESAQAITRKSLSVMPGMSNIVHYKEYTPHHYPLLIMVGDQDTALAKEISKDWHEYDPQSLFITIEDAGHCANMDNAEIFNSIYYDFIKTVKL